MNKKTMFKNFLKWITFVLCVLPLSAAAQVLNTPTAESPVHFANTTDFSAGTLTVSFQLGGGQNTAEVEITLPQGIEYAGAVTPSSGATAVLKTGSTLSKPVFNVTAVAGSSVTLAVKRKVVAAVMSNTNALGNGFEDSVVLTVNGNRSAPKKNAVPYQLPHPTLTVQQPEGTQNNAAGTHNKEYEIQNTGNGIVRDVYFSIAYPPGVTGNSVAYKIGSGIYTTLTQVGTVPSGSPNAGKPLYKVPAVHLANGQSVKIRENYTVTGCTSGRQIIYYAYWGVAPNNLFKNSPIASKTLNVDSGKPLINIDRGNNSSYFTWGDGLAGNKLGTFTVRYFNNGTGLNPTASKIRIKLFERHTGIFDSHKPENFRLVYTDGGVEKEIPIPSSAISQPVTNQAITISFDNIPALSASDPTHGSKNIGFTDEDGDGYRDELKQTAGFTLRFDYVKNRNIACGIVQFVINPSSEMYCENICNEPGTNGGAYLYEQTFVRFVNGVSDGSNIPQQLIQNVPKSGYLMANFNVSGYTNFQRLKGQAFVENSRLYKYKIKLPPGIELKNVQFYKGFKYGTSTEPPIPLSNVPAGGELTYTTTTTAYGYITFDILLTNCSGTNATINYSVSYLDKNGATNTYSEIPYVCTSTTISTVCSTPCLVNGPTMLSTKVERADNSYGWKDHTMAVRQTRDQVSELQRQRALYLDDIEVISTGKELNVQTNNLYYHASFKKAPGLKPKSIVFTTGTHSATLAGTTAVKTTVGDKDYFRWDLTSALPAGGIPANGTFTVVATYQVMNNSDDKGNNSHDVESGGENFFYRLNNPATDTALNAKGYHTAEQHCGANLYATFFYANLWNHLNTNAYYVDGCTPSEIGSQQVYAGRRFDAGGNYFTDEFRPSRLIKKITFKIPSSMNYVGNPTYKYRQKYVTESSPIPFTLTFVSDDGTYKTYTYVNPAKGQLGHLPVGEISVENFYDSYIRTVLQATCKTKMWDNFAKSEADNMLVKSEIEYEDFYYHYAAQGGSAIKTYSMPKGLTAVYHRYKPDVAITSLTPLTVKVNKREQELRFSLANSTQSDAPYSWVSIPDVTGVEILSLTEIASGGAHVRTYTAQTSISGEKMFFLNEGGAPGTIVKNGIRYFKVNYKITNCNANYALKVYAGWNCNENPTGGYKSTCSDKFLTYNISIAQTKKEIIADPTNPGESNANKVGTISMCAKTPYSYTINSANEGDLYDAKLVVTQAAGITFHDIEVEYPLGSGIKYNTTTLVNGKKIGHTVVGSKHTFDISAILPSGSLPGSESEKTIAANRQLKLTFKVMPDCDFAAGSSFDIDIEGNDLCGNPASGDKSRAIIAGIAGVNVNRYSINLDPLTYVSGNGTACDGGIVYKTRVTVSSSDPSFVMGSNARLRFTIPEGYELASSYAHYINRTPYGPGALWANPARKQSEERTLASGSELVLDIPAGMKSGQFFEFGVGIVQKANTLIDCATPKTLKAFATDTVTGVTCSLLPPPSTCPALTVGTSLERTVEVKNDRPELSFKDISTSSVIQGGKEKLTIKYKVTNAATASATLTARPVVASLYYDVNNNGRVDSGDTKLTTYTTTETLGQGGTSPERSFDYLADQNKVCRLLLVLKNEDNICLCGDVATKVTAPTELTGLVNSLTTCATDSVTFQYNAQAPAYAGYEWKAVSPSNALGYLNNTNTPTPTFAYTGAPLSSALTVTYNLVVKRTNGCEATQTVTVLVKAVPAPVLTVSPTLVVSCKAANATTTINNWLQQAATATASAPCATIASLTHNYDSVKPANLCEATVVTVTYTAKDNYGNITTKTTTITVVSIKANNDTVTVSHGATATTTTQTVLTNDKANTRTATTSTVSLTVTTPAIGVTGSATPTLNTNGTITVPTGTKSGTYQIGYRICTTVSAVTACDTATATIVVGAATITAIPDVVTVTVGSTSSKSVIDNDHIGTATATTNTASVTVVTPATPKASGTATPTLDSTGKITVPNNTPAGTYTIVYSICEKLNAGNCTTTTATVVVPLTPITATPDVVTVTVGSTSTKSVIDNDHIGTATATTSTASVTVVTGATPKASGTATPTLDSTGKVTVPNNTPAGTYTIVYRICEKLNAGNCTTTTATVVVPLTPITATPDVVTVTVGSTSSKSVIDNDHIGTATATTSTASVTVVTGATPKASGTATPTLDSTGKVTVPNNTPAGTYTIVYRICEKLNAGNCTTTTATIVVPLTPITATPDVVTVTVGSTSSGSVIDNDHIGTATATTNTASVTVVTPATPKASGTATPTLDSTGKITVPNNTPAGTYTIVYRICEKLNSGNCTTTTATVVVPLTPITATPDVVTVTVGSTSSKSVIDNDHIGTATATTNTASVTVVTPATPKAPGTATPTLDSTGKITVPNNTPAGTYTIVYRICEKLNAGNCTSTTATIVVPQTPITATPDVVTVTVGSTSSKSVIDNDHIGTATATTNTASVTVVTPATPKAPGTATPTLTPEGKVTVPNNTPAGTYTIVYSICEKLNAGNCTTTTATVVVPLTPITATPDVVTVTVGSTSSKSVIDNDHIGTATATTNTASVTVVTPATPKAPGTATPTLDSTGKITVPNNTPAGTYTIVYRICEKLNAGNCTTTTATVVVPLTPITATPDVVTVTVGSTSSKSVIDNDHIGTATATTSTASVTVVTPATPKASGTATPTLDSTGKITVPNNTPAGTYTIVYRICEKLNAGNCTTTTATIVVPQTPITATPDVVTVTVGSTSSKSVIDNDHIGTATATTSTASVTVVTPATPKAPGTATPTLNSDGTVTVPNNTPAGTYTIVYRICEKLNAGNCTTTTATVVVPLTPITATPDVVTVTVGSTSSKSVIDNDHIGTATATTSTASVTVVTGASPKAAGTATPTLNSDGTVTVPNNTPAGTYTIVYRICEKLNAGNCTTTTATVVVPLTPITATPDVVTVTVGSTSSKSVIDNDHIGTATATTNTASVTVVTPATPKAPGTATPTLDSTGKITVPNNTPAGTYTIVYRICEKLNAGNCTTTTATVVVPLTPITATPDVVTVTVGSTSSKSVIDNDHIGTATATTNTASVTVVTPATPKASGTATPTLDSTGKVTVPNNTPAGTYTIVYRICEKLNAGNCTTTTATVVVPLTPITATPDVVTVTVGSTSSKSVIDNDHIGTATTTTSTVSVTVVTPATPKAPGTATPTLDSTGKITVPNNTPAGTYTIVYRICEKLNAGNCTTTTATVVVPLTPITATPDVVTVTVGSTSSKSVIDNDHIGTATATTNTASVTVVTGASPKAAGTATPTLNSDGTVTVPNNTPAGTYTIVYSICEKLNAGNCTSTTATIVVPAQPTVTPTITVGGDSYTVTGTITSPTTVGNILTNDSLGGQTPTVASVTIHTATPTSATTPRIDPSTGNVIIPAGTPSGTYTMTYYLCERANSSNCSTPTTVTVNVIGVSTPTVTPTTIEANGDTFVQNGVPTSTTTLGNILTNDKLNGNLNPAVQSVTITTPSMPAHTPYIHPGTGEVIVPPHTPVGVYELPYTICALASPTVCDTATAVVTVNSIEAHNDGRHLLGTTVGGTISSVLANDKLNGRTPAASEVTINWQAAPAGFTYNADGSITVAAGTAVGTYTISYTLCATATPTLCSEPAEVVVEVTAATPVPPLSITAVYDGVYYIEKGTATALTSVLANDLLDSDPATTGNVSLTWDISAPAGFTLNADGTAHVATNTAVGRYEIPYTICAKNGTLCSTTKLVVTVLAPTVTPTIEVNGETFTYTGSPTVGNVLTNEKLNGTPNPSVRSVTISIMPPPPGAYEPYLDPSTGDIIVPPHTPAGNYTITYRVCTIDTPVACGVASVVVVIPPAPTPTPTVVPIAADDRVETARNTPVTINVLANDTPNGATTPNVVTAPLNGTAVVNPDGTIEYTPNTGFVGTDRLVYTLCNASGCATATVNIEVTNKLIVYNGVSVNGSDKNNHFHIAGIEAYPDNTVRIYNRWGVKVWEVQSYDNVRNVFKGISNGRVTVEAADKLPQGTYYYIIEYVDENNQKQTMVGWLYLKKD